MFVASKFCYANDLFWDGVISEKINLREFLYTQAAYQLLDFTILGGQFSLFPSVPITQTSRLTLGQRQVSKTSPSLDCSRMGTSGTSGQHSFHQKSASCLSQS